MNSTANLWYRANALAKGNTTPDGRVKNVDLSLGLWILDTQLREVDKTIDRLSLDPSSLSRKTAINIIDNWIDFLDSMLKILEEDAKNQGIPA